MKRNHAGQGTPRNQISKQSARRGGGGTPVVLELSKLAQEELPFFLYEMTWRRTGPQIRAIDRARINTVALSSASESKTQLNLSPRFQNHIQRSRSCLAYERNNPAHLLARDCIPKGNSSRLLVDLEVIDL